MSLARASSRAGTVRGVLAIAAAVHLLLAFPPWSFTFARRGLEASWHQVISHAAASGWQWGRDIDFTYGPLGFVRFPVFEESLVGPTLAWNGLLGGALIAGVLALLRAVPLPAAIVIYSVTVLSASMLVGKGVYATLPLIAALLHFERPAASPRWTVVALVIAAGIFANAYVSSLALGVVTCALMDASRIIHRRAPVFVPLYAVAFFAAFLLAGQDVATFPAFLRSVVEIIAGYPDAMSIYGPTAETVAFLGTSLVAAALVIGCERVRTERGLRDADAWLLVAAIGAFWFLTWKSGFVRHDLHSVLAWGGLSIGLAAYAAARVGTTSPAALRIALIAVAAATSCAAVWRSAKEVSLAGVGARARDALAAAPAREFAQGVLLVTRPDTWLAARRAEADAARAQLRATFPAFAAHGTVDMVGFEQGALFARGLDYRPRPVFHDYAAYTRWLIDANQMHWRRDRAAGTLFVTNATIDNRYPLLDTGKSIVELLTRYRTEEPIGDYLRLQRRPVPLDAHFTEGLDAKARWGEWLAIPGADTMIMLEAQIRLNLGGRLLGFALRPPSVALTVKLADGSERTHRIVPAMAAEGFLLSPYADLPSILAAHAAGRLSMFANARVTAVRFDADPASAASYYDEEIRVHATAIDVTAVGVEPMSAGLRRMFARYDVVGELAQSVAGKGQNVKAQGALLFAHAPASPRVTLEGPFHLRVAYGIGAGAFTGSGRTDGVCFRILATGPDGKSTTLHERCLEPLERAADRGEQEATMRVDVAGPVEITFETDCRRSCDWDWSFWKNFDVQPARR